MAAPAAGVTEEAHEGRVSIVAAANGRQFLQHSLTGEACWLDGSGWSFAFNAGKAYIYRGSGILTETKWVSHPVLQHALLKQTLHKRGDRFFVLNREEGTTKWLDVLMREHDDLVMDLSKGGESSQLELWKLKLAHGKASIFGR